MANFQYRAIDANGRPVEGEMTAPDLFHLERQLQDLGLWLVRTLESKPKSLARTTQKRGRVKPRDLMEFSTHMFTLLEAGIPLTQALKSLSIETPNLHLRATLQAIFQQVEAGNTLHDAMKQHPRTFPPQITNLVHAGEDSGTLTDTFKELERYLDWLDQIRGDVRQATIYPSIVIVAVMGLLVLLFTFVIPRFVPILEGLHVPLPTITIIVITLSEFFVGSWWLWSAFLLLGPMVWVVGRKYLPGFVHWRDRMILQLPVLGELIRMLTISKFVQNFAVLYRAGIPVLQSLQLCQGLVGNSVMERALQDTQRAVSEGSTINESLSRHPVFPPMVIQMISVGEATGTLPNTLMNVANYYNREIPRRIKKVFGILEPVITLVLIGIVGIVALALFMPMMSLMGGIH
ncbi:MAG: type II secretion system F family protein [Nitrospirales bacterium]|nr:type II secretion system F family protein [Nitrospirales bacterium]